MRGNASRIHVDGGQRNARSCGRVFLNHGIDLIETLWKCTAGGCQLHGGGHCPAPLQPKSFGGNMLAECAINPVSFARHLERENVARDYSVFSLAASASSNICVTSIFAIANGYLLTGCAIARVVHYLKAKILFKWCYGWQCEIGSCTR